MGKRDRITLENVLIESIAQSNAVAHVDGKALFVPFCIPGDVVDVQVTHRRNSYLTGYVLRTVTPSPMRIAPFCAHFGDCGGCSWQILPYDKQLEYKQQQVVDQLTRLGHLTLPPVRPILGSAKTECYRNKLEFTFSHDKWRTFAQLAEETAPTQDVPTDAPAADEAPRQEIPALGFHINGRFDKVLDINECHLQAAPSNEIRLFIKRYAIDNNLSFFNLRSQKGLLRNLMIRIATTGEIMVLLVVTVNDPRVQDLLAATLSKFPQITSLQYIINNKKNDNFSDLPVTVYAGKPSITEKMEDLQFIIGPKSFYQTNSLQACRLYGVVRDLAQLNPDQRVYDLYTGTGTIALFLARHCKEVIGIEYIPEAIADARVNAQCNGIGNARFFAGDMKDVLTASFLESEGAPDVVVLDPPRAGVHQDVLDVLIKAAAPRMVYVSCNPATQARDVQYLSAYYKVTAVQPVDMFPHTQHVENVLLLERI